MEQHEAAAVAHARFAPTRRTMTDLLVVGERQTRFSPHARVCRCREKLIPGNADSIQFDDLLGIGGLAGGTT